MLDRSVRTTSRTAGWRLAMLACAGILFILPGAAAGSEQRFTPIVKATQKASPSVVSIRGEKTVLPGPQTPANEAPRRVNGMGSGIVIDPRGYILTNYHVVDGVREIQVTTADNKQYIATLVARDAETDLAVIKISPGGEDGSHRAGHVVGPHAGRAGGCRGQRLRLRLHGHRRHRQRLAPGGADQRRSVLR